MSAAEKIDVLGVRFDNVTLDEAVDRAESLMAERRAAYVVTPNPEIVMICREDALAAEAVAGAALTIPDGIGVIYGARMLKTPLREKVPGIDLTTRLLRNMAAAGQRVFLLGAKPGVAEQAGRNLEKSFPGLCIAGTHDGYFTEDAGVIAEINAAAPDLLLVCLGAPKQEKWMHVNAAKLNVGLMIGAGGSLDVFAGNVQRAPAAMQKAGLEWLYRLWKEPRRIGRMMVLPKFLLTVPTQKRKK